MSRILGHKANSGAATARNSGCDVMQWRNERNWHARGGEGGGVYRDGPSDAKLPIGPETHPDAGPMYLST